MNECINKYSDKLTVNQPEMKPVTNWINRLNNNTLEKEKQKLCNLQRYHSKNILGYKLEVDLIK